MGACPLTSDPSSSLGSSACPQSSHTGLLRAHQIHRFFQDSGKLKWEELSNYTQVFFKLGFLES